MPELPEVEIIRRQLSQEVVGKVIAKIWWDTPKMLKPSPQVFINLVKNQKLTCVDRRAKLLLFCLSNGSILTTHLKLSGRLLYRPAGFPPDEYVHVILRFSDGSQLRFSNARKFGYMEVFNSTPAQQRSKIAQIKEKYGPEPLDDLEWEEFYEILKGGRRKVKVLLMDQSCISGIGNIYANEALWMAKIHPETPANRISREKAKRLFEALELVLKEALAEGGSSDNWYRQIHGEKGHYQEHFKVYQRTGKPCRRCGTRIEYAKVSQRGTFYCPHCQSKEG